MIIEKEFDLKKLDNGMARTYDYIVKECIEKGWNLVIKYNKKYMTITNEQLKNTKQIDNRRYPTQYLNGNSPKFYSWIHFKWKPDNIEVTNTKTLFDTVQLDTNSI